MIPLSGVWTDNQLGRTIFEPYGYKSYLGSCTRSCKQLY